MNTVASPFADEQTDPTPTFFRFDMEKVHVMHSKVFTISGGGQRNWLAERKMWIPLRKKLVLFESTADQGTVGQLKDMNYYLMLEMYDPFGIIGDTANDGNWHAAFEEKVYYKDA